MRKDGRPARKATIILVLAGLFLFTGVRAAFSATRVADREELDAGLALPVLAAGTVSRDDLSFLDLSALRFIMEEQSGETPHASDADVDPRMLDEEETPKPSPESARPPRRPSSHLVKTGESLGSIAQRYGLQATTLQSVNQLKIATVQPGQKLTIPSSDGIAVRVEKGRTLWDISRLYRVRVSEIMAANDLANPNELRAGEIIFLPGGRALSAPEIRRAAARGNGPGYVWPVANGRISSKFGYRRHPIRKTVIFHRGLDIAAPQGTPIRAVLPGTVTFSGRRGGYGHVVEIKHANGLVTRYAHNERNIVKAGVRVRAGEQIARVGSSGISTGPHLHFEVIRRGERLDPLLYLAAR